MSDQDLKKGQIELPVGWKNHCQLVIALSLIMEVPTLSMRSPLHTEAGELLEGLSVEVGMECKSVTAESGVSDRGTFLSLGDTEG